MRRLSTAYDKRRGLDRSMSNDAALSKYAIEQIGLLYEVERKADDENLTYDERRDLRMRLAIPILQTPDLPDVAEKEGIGTGEPPSYN